MFSVKNHLRLGKPVIQSGKLNVKIAGDNDWTLITEGMDFNVPKNSSFCLEVSELVNYTCSYFDD